MKVILAAVLAVGCAAVALPAAAASQWVASVEYTQLDFTQGGPSPGLVTGQFAYRSSHYWGIEAEGSTGVIKDQGINIGDEFAGYATATVPIGSSVDLFARGGYGQLGARQAGISKADFWAYGAGGDLWLNKNLGVRIDYTRQTFTRNIPDANVYSAGLAYRF